MTSAVTTTEPVQLYGVAEIAQLLGTTRQWVNKHHARKGAPKAAFKTIRGDSIQLLFTQDSLDHWRAYQASGGSTPTKKRTPYSDHEAVNQVGPLKVTWKLWWTCTFDGGATWWFSTPQGWFTSTDDGLSWSPTALMTRPLGFRYFSVNGSAAPRGAVKLVLQEADRLRLRILKMYE